MFATWEDIVTKMAESEKVYNTLLKTRYALENNLISIGKCNKELKYIANLKQINETLLKH